MNKLVAAASLWLLALLTGCATQLASMDTINGKPEITLLKASAPQMKDYLKDHMINMGFGLEKESEFQLVFGRGKQPLVQPSWGYRVTYSMIDLKPGLRVVADVTMVSDQGTARERPYEGGLTQPTDDPQAAVERQIEGVLRTLAYTGEIPKISKKKAG